MFVLCPLRVDMRNVQHILSLVTTNKTINKHANSHNLLGIGQLGLFYHSSCKEPGVVGIVQISKAGKHKTHEHNNMALNNPLFLLINTLLSPLMPKMYP